MKTTSCNIHTEERPNSQNIFLCASVFELKTLIYSPSKDVMYKKPALVMDQLCSHNAEFKYSLCRLLD